MKSTMVHSERGTQGNLSSLHLGYRAPGFEDLG
jgi:hypothetical protein